MNTTFRRIEAFVQHFQQPQHKEQLDKWAVNHAIGDALVCCLEEKNSAVSLFWTAIEDYYDGKEFDSPQQEFLYFNEHRIFEETQE